MPQNHGRTGSTPPAGSDTDAAEADPFPDWFTAFLHDRQNRKPSAHTMKACRQDFIAIADLVTDGDPADMNIVDITKDSMRAAFAAYAQDHEAASIRRCWSTWNVLCTFLYTGEQLAANPMQLVGRPKLSKALPKALPRNAVEALLETVAQDRNSTRQTDWAERDLAIILTALLAGLRAQELCGAEVGDVRTTNDGAAVIHVRGRGGKERSIPIEAELLSVIQTYLDSRAVFDAQDHHLMAYTAAPKGLSGEALRPEQRELLGALVSAASEGPIPIADTRPTWDDDSLSELHIAWGGDVDGRGPIYFRLQAPRLFFEYDNTQRDANHAHSVLRGPC